MKIRARYPRLWHMRPFAHDADVGVHVPIDMVKGMLKMVCCASVPVYLCLTDRQPFTTTTFMSRASAGDPDGPPQIIQHAEAAHGQLRGSKRRQTSGQGQRAERQIVLAGTHPRLFCSVPLRKAEEKGAKHAHARHSCAEMDRK